MWKKKKKILDFENKGTILSKKNQIILTISNECELFKKK